MEDNKEKQRIGLESYWNRKDVIEAFCLSANKASIVMQTTKGKLNITGNKPVKLIDIIRSMNWDIEEISSMLEVDKDGLNTFQQSKRNKERIKKLKL